MAAAVEAAPEPVVYAVPGSPLVAERTVELLRADGRVEVTRPARPSPSWTWPGPRWASTPWPRGCGWSTPACSGPWRGPRAVRSWWRSAGRATCSPRSSSPCPDDDGLELPRPVLLHHLGLEDEVVAAVDWWELDRTVEPDHLTSLYMPGPIRTDGCSAGDEVARLVALMDTLRERCPWDRAQTHDSLMPHLVEESYEVLDALGRTARRAERRCRACAPPGGAGRPAVPDRLPRPAGRRSRAGSTWPTWRAACTTSSCTATRTCSATSRPTTRTQVVTNWEAIKKSEKGRSSVTEGIPAGLPALMLATKLARKATRRRRGARRRGRRGDGAAAGRGRRGTPRAPTRSPTIRCRPTTATSHGGRGRAPLRRGRTWRSGSASTRNRRCATVPCRTRADIRAAEGVPEAEVGNR